MSSPASAAERALLNRYLLGDLSAAEADAVEDRFAVDDGYFGLYQEVERALVREYATGAMEPDDAARFERNYIVSAQRRNQVTIARALLDVQAEQRGAPAKRRAALRRAALVFASALLLIALALFFWGNRRPPPTGRHYVALPRMQPPASPHPFAPAPAQAVPPQLARTKSPSPPPQVPPPAARTPLPQSDTSLRDTLAAEGNKSLRPRTQPTEPGPPPQIQQENEVAANENPALTASPQPNVEPPPGPPAQRSDKEENDRALPLLPRAASPSLDMFYIHPQTPWVAVLDFRYAAANSVSRAVNITGQDIGRGVADLLADQLAIKSPYRIVDRQQTEKVKELLIRPDGLSDARRAVDIGLALGADGVITGDITQFDAGDVDSKPAVVITARLIEVHNGQIRTSVTGKGKPRSLKEPKVFVRNGDEVVTHTNDMRSHDFALTNIGQAVMAATGQLAAGLDASGAKIPVLPLFINGEIFDISAGRVTISHGGWQRIRVGDRLAVIRWVRVNAGGAAERTSTPRLKRIGELLITSVNEDTAVGTFSGPGKPKLGDELVRLGSR